MSRAIFRPSKLGNLTIVVSGFPKIKDVLEHPTKDETLLILHTEGVDSYNVRTGSTENLTTWELDNNVYDFHSS